MLVSVSMMLAACASTGDPLSSATQRGGARSRVVVHAGDDVGPFDRRLLGTNVPAWLSPPTIAAEPFRQLLVASGTTMLRLPGGSWSNDYDWLGCEEGDADRCKWTWASRPSDFIGLLEATGLPAMWTASINGTAEEAAAAVAFFNGSVGDERAIGTDREGRDWSTVGHWAQLRADHGHPDPVGIAYWEVGNEVYGARSSVGPKCASWGWEDVWTCDGTEYVEGTADHDGFRQFREAMHAVDPTIAVGAVGVGDRGAWHGWDDAVMSAAGDEIDFYVVHNYGSDGNVPAEKVMAVPPKKWPQITGDLRDGFADHGIEGTPIAVTEHNLVAFMDGDEEKLMTTALNGFYLAETIGEMAANGVSIANQWNFANGRAPNGTDYGLIDTQTSVRSPAYYALALWSRFGEELVRTELGADLDGLVVYGGRRSDGSAVLMAINPTGEPIDATVAVDPAVASTTVVADVVQAASAEATSVTFNGSATPSLDLSEPEATLSTDGDGDLAYSFAGYSITLLRWSPTP